MLRQHLHLVYLLRHELFGGDALLQVSVSELGVVQVVRSGLKRRLIGQNLPLGWTKIVLIDYAGGISLILLID